MRPKDGSLLHKHGQRDLPAKHSGQALSASREKELIRKCQKGNPEAFAELYHRHSKQVFNIALRVLGSLEDAEDATQEIFLRVFENISSFKGRAKFSTWLYRVTVNACKNEWASARRGRGKETQPSDGQFDSLPTRDGDPTQVIERKETQQRIQRALDTLSDEHKTILILAATDGLSYKEIAEIIGLSDVQVRGRLYRARKAFKASFEALDK